MRSERHRYPMPPEVLESTFHLRNMTVERRTVSGDISMQGRERQRVVQPFSCPRNAGHRIHDHGAVTDHPRFNKRKETEKGCGRVAPWIRDSGRVGDLGASMLGQAIGPSVRRAMVVGKVYDEGSLDGVDETRKRPRGHARETDVGGSRCGNRHVDEILMAQPGQMRVNASDAVAGSGVGAEGCHRQRGMALQEPEELPRGVSRCTQDVGCKSHRCIVIHDSRIYFLRVGPVKNCQEAADTNYMKHRLRTRRSLMAKTLTMSLLVMVVGAVLAPVAHAQIGSLELPGGGVADGVGLGGGGSEGGDSGSGLIGGETEGLEGRNDSAASEGGDPEPNGPISGVIDAVDDTVDHTSDKVEEATGDHGTLDAITSGVGGTVGVVTETILRTSDGLSGDGRNKKRKGGRSSDGRSPTTSSSSISSGAEVLGVSLADALQADGRNIRAAGAGGTYVPTAASPSNQSVITQIGRVAAEAVRQAAFPIALILMVAAFLMVQNRIDSKDPKLALAPMDSEHDLLSFS